MKPAVQVKCPNCQNSLRVPSGLVNVSVKCKFCGFILLLKPKSAAPAAAINAFSNMQAGPAAQGWGQSPHGQNELPEFSPLPATQQAAVAYSETPFQHDEPTAAPAGYNPAFDRAKRYGRRASYRGPRGGGKTKLIVAGIAVVVSAGIFIAILSKSGALKETTNSVAKKEEGAGPTAQGDTKSGPNPKVGDSEGTRPTPVNNRANPFPRRLLAICVSDYLYANGLDYGNSATGSQSTRRDFYKAVDYLATGWHIPVDQRYYLSDGPVAESKRDEKHPPLKMVINGSIDRFLNTCRAQDRITIIFSGHAIEKDGEAYFVPIEGELDDIASLIPLKEFYDKLGKCAAQEKLVIFDVCRFDPGRGVERPTFGMMTEDLEKKLHDCPDGVTVWTSCSAGQYAYEYNEADVRFEGIRDLYGSIFFALFFYANRNDVFSRRQQGTGLQDPADPLPIAPISAYIDEKTVKVAQTLEKKPQTPKLTIKPHKEVAYNPNDALVKRFDLAQPPPTAKREEILAMFKEIDLPEVKALRKDENKNSRLADSFPFTEEQLKDYANSGPTFAEIEKAPNRFAKEFPLRAAAVEAIVEMRKMRQDASRELPDEFKQIQLTDKRKKELGDKEQRTIGERQGILEEMKDKLESAAKKRDMEKSKRWLANFDYAYAQVRLRLAYINEYNLALGKVRLGQLPELDEKGKNQSGWKLASVEKMMSSKDVRDMAEDAKTTFSEIVKANPTTPWTVLGKAQRHIIIGLKWEPSSFGLEADKP